MYARFSCVALGLLSTLGCSGRPAPRPAPTVQAVPATALSNGLALRVEPRPGSGVVVAHLATPAGSAAEGKAAGAAALTEALVRQRLDAAAPALGAQVQTWVDHATAHAQLTVAAGQLAAALDALRTATAPRALDADTLKAVAERLDLAQARARRAPQRRRIDRLLAEATPGLAPALPGSAALGAATPDAVRDFHAARLRPEGSALVIVGDVSEADAKAAARVAFGGWRGEARATSPGAIADDGPRIAVDRGPAPFVTAAFTVRMDGPAAAAELDLLAACLSGPGGRLTRALPTATVRAWPLLLDAGRALLVVEAQGVAPEQALPAIAATGAALADRPPSPAEIQAAAARLRGAMAASDDTFAARATRLAVFAGRWPEARTTYTAGLDASPAALAARAQGLLPKHLTAVVEATPPDGVDPQFWAERLAEQAAEAASSRPAAGPGLHALAEGVEVIIHPVAGAGAVSVFASVDGGAAVEPADQVGVAGLVAAGLGQAAVGEPLIGASAGPDHLAVWATAAPDRLDAAFAAVSRRVSGLQWAPERVEAARRLVEADAPGVRAARRMERLWWPAPADEALGSLTPANVQSWYDAQVAHAPLRVVVTGAVEPAEALRMVRPLLTPRRAIATVPPGPKVEARREARGTLDADRGLSLVAWAVPLETPAALAAAELVTALLFAPDGPLLDAVRRDGRVKVRPYHRLDGPRGLIGVHIEAPVGALGTVRGAVDSAAAKAGAILLEVDALRAMQARLVAHKRQQLQPTVARARWLAGHARSGRALTDAGAFKGWKAEIDRITPDALGRHARDLLKRDHRLVVELGRPLSARHTGSTQ